MDVAIGNRDPGLNVGVGFGTFAKLDIHDIVSLLFGHDPGPKTGTPLFGDHACTVSLSLP
jgi:hypothetical protein